MQTVTLSELSPYSGEQLIEQCYRKILLRDPDPVGIQHYRKWLESGKSRFSVIRGIANSSEARKLGVRVRGLWVVSITEGMAALPVIGTLYAILRLAGSARTVLRDISAVREIAAESRLRIEGVESQLAKQRDLDPVFNTLASTHHYMREVERRLAVLESTVANRQPEAVQSEDTELRSVVSSITFEVERVARELEAFRNITSSFPATMRDQLVRIAELKRQIGQPGSPDWETSIGGQLERVVESIEAHDSSLAKLVSGQEQESELNGVVAEKFDECLSLAQNVDSRLGALERLLDHSLKLAAHEVQRTDRSVQQIAEQGAKLEVVDTALQVVQVECTRLVEELESERLERSQLATRLDHSFEVVEKLRHASNAIQDALDDARAEWATRDDEHAAGVRMLANNTEHLGRSVGDIRASLDHAYNRIEFIRREALFESKYGPAPAFAEKPEISKTRVVNAPKVEAARTSAVKLNIGCGHIALADHVNVDRRELPGVDIIAEATNLPFEAGEVQVLRAAHLIEHFPQEQLRREVLPYWRSLVKQGGKLHIIVPDAEHMFSEYYRGTYPYENFREVLFGGQEYSGDFHYNMLMPAQLSILLREAGFETIHWLARGRQNGLCFEMELEAE
jgi:predicted SAM-dependent methyltransferase